MRGALGDQTLIYLQIAQLLEDDILRGVYREEEQVPSTNELSRCYNINPATAAKGINLLAAEGLLFMAACLYMLVECIRNGIWDRHIKPTAGANGIGSVVTGAGVFLFTLTQTKYWPGALFAGIFTIGLCFFTLQFTVLLYKKRHDQLEYTEEDEDERLDANH